MFSFGLGPMISTNEKTIEFFVNIIKDLDYFMDINKTGTSVETYKNKMSDLVISLKCFKETLVVEDTIQKKQEIVATEDDSVSIYSNEWEMVEPTCQLGGDSLGNCDSDVIGKLFKRLLFISCECAEEHDFY